MDSSLCSSLFLVMPYRLLAVDSEVASRSKTTLSLHFSPFLSTGRHEANAQFPTFQCPQSANRTCESSEPQDLVVRHLYVLVSSPSGPQPFHPSLRSPRISSNTRNLLLHYTTTGPQGLLARYSEVEVEREIDWRD